nr:MAG: DnaA-like replication initiator protein [uncultured archaeon]
MFEDIFQYHRTPEWELKRLIVVGSQNSGKSCFIRSLVSYIQKLYDSNDINAFLTNDIRVLELDKYKHLWRRPIQICIIDDAVGKIDSRRSMSSSNIAFTQRYFQIRHILEEKGCKNGLIIVILATQMWYAIDRRIRDNVQVTIFKTYYREKIFQEMMNYDEDLLKFIKDATYESLIKSNMVARSAGIGVIQTGDIFQFRNRKVNANEVNLPLLLYESGKQEFIQLLIAKIMNQFGCIFKVPDKLIKGYLQFETDNLKHLFPGVKITSTDYGYIIRWGVYLQYQDQPNILNNKELDGWVDKDIIYFHDTLGLSFQEIEDEYGIAHSTAHNIHKRFKREQENRIDELINNGIVQIDS